MKTINVTFTDKEFEQLQAAKHKHKHKLAWQDFLLYLLYYYNHHTRFSYYHTKP